MIIKRKPFDLKILLWISVAIFIVAFSTTAFSGDWDNFKSGRNQLQREIDDYFRSWILKDQLYRNGEVDAGSQGILSRRNLVLPDGDGEFRVAIIRYGNKKNRGGLFPFASWEEKDGKRYIREQCRKNRIDPDTPLEDLSSRQRRKKRKFINTVGFSVGQQHEALKDKRRELGRALSPTEIAAVRAAFPTKIDKQIDEFETLLVVDVNRKLGDHADVRVLHDIFADQNDYHRMLEEDFLVSHMYTDEELAARGIELGKGESLFYAHLMVDDQEIRYTVFNQSSHKKKRVQLRTKSGNKTERIDVVTLAWRIYEPHTKPEGFRDWDPIDKREFEEKVGTLTILPPESEEPLTITPFNQAVLMIDGYLILEPYIVQDADGYQSISESHVIGLYHVRTKVDPKYKPLKNTDPGPRLAIGRGVIEGMIKEFRKKLSH